MPDLYRYAGISTDWTRLRPAADVPVEPDADEARDWAREELAGRVYEDARPSLVDRVVQAVLDWLRDVLDGLGGLGTGPGVLILLLTAGLIVALAVLVIRPRLNSAVKKKTSGVFDKDLVEQAADHRARAEDAAARRQWNTALAERFRAMVRSGEERVIFEARPARTAAEAGDRLTAAFPGSGSEIMWLRQRFDEVRYGNRTAGAEDYRRAAALDAALEAARPAAPELQAVPVQGLAVPR